MNISNNKLLAVWVFGFMSGFTLMISSYTLNYWLSEESINLKTIGIFSLISLPYAVNFIWAPIFDTIKIPYLSKKYTPKIAWLIIVQLLLSVVTYATSLHNPLDNIFFIALFATFIAFFASAQDSILGAMRTEIVDKSQQGEISGIYIFGYRIGMLLSSSGAVFISQFFDWQYIYRLFSCVVMLFPFLLILLLKQDYFLSAKPRDYKLKDPILKTGFYQKITLFVKDILSPVGSKLYLITAMIFLILYRLPDNFISIMITPFLLNIGYEAFEISTAGKLFGALSAMMGGLIASLIMKNRPLYSSLLLFGSIHAAAHLLYIYQYFNGKDIYILYLITGVEGMSGGMTMAAYIAFIASLCEGQFRATQYAFFSSMMGFSRAIFPSISGYIVLSYGWSSFFIFTTIATLPALLLIPFLQKLSRNDG
ncbi:MAG: hypothetical protein DGJ47_001114 [Rickettsiaceae bacterium]